MEFVTGGFGASLLATVYLTGIIFACAQAGDFVLTLIGAPLSNRLERGILAAGVGIVFLSLLILVIGSARLLSVPVLCGLFIFSAITPFFVKKRKIQAADSGGVHVLDLKFAFFCLLTGSVLFLAWLRAVSPPIGNDALAYHLAHPKIFVTQGIVGYLPGTRESLWPYLTEMFFAVGLALQGTALATLFHWCFFGMTTAAIYSFCRTFSGDRRLAVIASLLFLFTPAIFSLAGEAYVELSLLFFIFLSVYALMLSSRIGGVRAAILSGIFMGGALSVKYLALGAFAALFFIWLWEARVKKPAWVFLVVTVAVSGVWYLRSWVELGNPVYPFFYRFFSGHGVASNISEGVGMGKGVVSFLRLLWDITMYPAPFGGEILGPFYLLFAPWAIFRFLKSGRQARLLAVFCMIYGVFVFVQTPFLRFFMPLIPFGCIAAAAAASDLLSRGGVFKKLTVSVLLAVIVLHSGIYFYRTRNLWPVWLGTITTEQYLLKYERSFAGNLYLKHNAQPGARLFNAGEVRRFYDPFNQTVFDNALLRQDLTRQNKTLSEYLDKEPFDYIWLHEGSPAELKNYVSNRPYSKVYSYSFSEGDVRFDFLIYKFSA